MSAEPEQTAAGSTTTAQKGGLRRLLMLGVPLVVVLIAATLYLAGGRFVSTDNAYVKADIAAISPEIAGNVVEVLVTDNQKVTKGQPLLAIDAANYRVAVAGTEAQLRAAVANIESAKARYRQKEESIALMQTNVRFAEREYQRQAQLASANYVAAAKLDQAQHALESARRNLRLLHQEKAEILATLEGDPQIRPEDHPAYQQAMAANASAKLMMERATLSAPFDGVVSQVPRVGDFARTGAPILSLVSTSSVWVEANFKETDLTQMRPGQPVEIDVDSYPDHKFRGHVASISQATGAEFSVLPAQNSSGNWVKVVQRIPVRITFDDPKNGPTLRAGMSVIAEVDTGLRRASKWLGAYAGDRFP
ncbi:MAG: HlyD family secretion protein [Rhodospirillaceae bacterium]